MIRIGKVTYPQSCFHTVICGEARNIKGVKTRTSTSVQWLKARFHILATATPTPNGVNDWVGYMPFIEIRDDLRDGSYAGVDLKTLDPFELDDDHLAAILDIYRKSYSHSFFHSSRQYRGYSQRVQA